MCACVVYFCVEDLGTIAAFRDHDETMSDYCTTHRSTADPPWYAIVSFFAMSTSALPCTSLPVRCLTLWVVQKVAKIMIDS